MQLLFELGSWDEALRESQGVLEWDRAQGGTQLSMLVLAAQAQVLVNRGEIATAEGLVAALLPLARRIGDLQALTHSLPSAATVECAGGRLPAAAGLMRELEKATRNNPNWRSHRLPDCVRVCLTCRELELAEKFLAGTEPLTKRSQVSVLSARAALTEARGALDTAVDLYREAARLWREFEHVPEEAQAWLGLGRCNAALGRPEEARPALEEAAAILGRLGARPLLAECERVLAAIGPSS